MINNNEATLNNNVLIYKLFNINNILKQILIVLLGSVVLAISTHVYIPTYPVPFTLQSLIVLIIGATLGKKLGTLSVLAFIVEALIGLPVLGTVIGFAIFSLPSAGYIIGMVFAAYISGLMAEKGRGKTFKHSLPYLLIAHQIIFVFGVAYLSWFLGSLEQGFIYGYLPFMGVDFIKILIACYLIPLIWKFSNNFNK